MNLKWNIGNNMKKYNRFCLGIYITAEYDSDIVGVDDFELIPDIKTNNPNVKLTMMHVDEYYMCEENTPIHEYPTIENKEECEEPKEPEYTDEQFYTDIKKSSDALDLMAQEALEEHAQGKTRKFPQ
jgi:hypothetical protein